VWNVSVADCAFTYPDLVAVTNHVYVCPAGPVLNWQKAAPEVFEVVVQTTTPLTVNLTVAP